MEVAFGKAAAQWVVEIACWLKMEDPDIILMGHRSMNIVFHDMAVYCEIEGNRKDDGLLSQG